MSDPILRELERRAAIDVAAALPLSHALERVGRIPAALKALWQGCGDLAVRRVAAEFACDRAVPRRVQVAWQVKLPGRDALRMLRAWPLALAVGSVQRTLLLDPRTGEVRGELPAAGTWRPVRETVVVADAGACAAADAWTGERLWSTRLEGGKDLAVGEDLAVAEHRGAVVAHRHEDPRRLPVEVWRRPIGLGRLRSGSYVDSGLAVLHFAGTTIVLDAHSGTERFRRLEGVGGAGHGVVVARRGEALEILDASDGRLLWTTTMGPATRVDRITPTSVILQRWADEGVTFSIHDRLTGACTDTIALDFVPRWQVDDVYFTAVGSVTARTRERELWTWRPKRPGAGYEVATLPGRVYVLTAREVYCLVEA